MNMTEKTKNKEPFRCGFIALTGRPNVGKSTLMNALVDADVAITSSKPETTRKAIRAILTTENYQMIFVDTPGIHRPKTLLGKRLNQMVDEQITSVDLILFLSPADEKIGKGDNLIINHLKQLKRSGSKIVAVVTKIDKVKPEKLLEHLTDLSAIEIFTDFIPVSAKTDENLNKLIELILKYLPISEQLYDDIITDESKYDMISEVVRASALEDLNNELPHSLAVQVDEIVDNEIYINLFVERDSQKAIIIGKGESESGIYD